MRDTSDSHHQKPTVPGILLTAIITMGFLWALLQLFTLSYKPNRFTMKDIRQNELTAFRNMKRMAAAQEAYIQKDWDGDGEKLYAMFYVHLWQSVTPEGKPIPVDLISRTLAFAVDTTKMLDGYYYKDLHRRGLPDRTGRDLLYEREWAIIAHPAIHGKSGGLTFIADQSGKVFVTPRMYTEKQYPVTPESNGWILINNIEDLKDFQSTIIASNR
jgi:hypothetical protein